MTGRQVADAQQQLEDISRAAGRVAVRVAAQAAAAMAVGPIGRTLVTAVLEEVLARRAEDRVEQDITDDSPQRRAGEAEILKFLADDDVPRRAKRMVNQLRLLLLVAAKREMLGGVPPLKAAHLGKWVVLWERWPELGRAIRATPSIMTLLEDTAERDPHSLGDVLGATIPRVVLSADLAKFLSDQTKLGGLVERLVYYQRAQEVAPDDARAEVDHAVAQ
jgi:hypothetical protein